MLTTQSNKFDLQRISFLVVLWAFAACALSNWGSCFLNLQVFFLFAARWALSATVETIQLGTRSRSFAIHITSERDVCAPRFLFVRSFYESNKRTHIQNMVVRSNLKWFLCNILKMRPMESEDAKQSKHWENRLQVVQMKYIALLTIATNIPQRLMTGFVVQGHILTQNWVTFFLLWNTNSYFEEWW